MQAIVTKYAFEVLEVPEENREQLREICNPSYAGPAEPADVLAMTINVIPELRELVIVDEGEVIYDGAV